MTENEVTATDCPPRIFSIRCNKFCIIVEKEICMDGISCLANALLFFFGMHYVADLEYHKRIKATMTFIQMGMLGLDARKIPEKIHSFVQKLTG